MNLLRGILLSGGLLVAAVSLSAQVVVVNTFGSSNGGYGYNGNSGRKVNGSTAVFSSPDGARQLAESFTASASGALSSLTLALSNSDNDIAYDVTVRLVAGGANPALGSVLETWTLATPTALPELGDAATAPQTFTSVTNTMLTSGQTYWIWLSATTGDTNILWNLTDGAATSTPSANYSLQNSGAWFTLSSGAQSAFRVSVVPEPSTYAVFFGLAVFGVVVWRRRRA